MTDQGLFHIRSSFCGIHIVYTTIGPMAIAILGAGLVLQDLNPIWRQRLHLIFSVVPIDIPQGPPQLQLPALSQHQQGASRQHRRGSDVRKLRWLRFTATRLGECTSESPAFATSLCSCCRLTQLCCDLLHYLYGRRGRGASVQGQIDRIQSRRSQCAAIVSSTPYLRKFAVDRTCRRLRRKDMTTLAFRCQHFPTDRRKPIIPNRCRRISTPAPDLPTATFWLSESTTSARRTTSAGTFERCKGGSGPGRRSFSAVTPDVRRRKTPPAASTPVSHSGVKSSTASVAGH